MGDFPVNLLQTTIVFVDLMTIPLPQGYDENRFIEDNTLFPGK
ncbi:MAG: hypothetical protein WBM62_02275 [Crocosphaera sp.]